MDPTLARVYVETSIISYLRSRPSRDVVIAGHQALTRRWWRTRRNYSLFASQVSGTSFCVKSTGINATVNLFST